jgi:hypothetical protein
VVAQRDDMTPPRTIVPLDTILCGDALETLRGLPDASVDAIVTDPPAGIAFMGKGWDMDKGGRREWIAWLAAIMAEALRVVKPGGHALVWALPRTSHWTATALEDAGWSVRDVITHINGQGFPKSADISKHIDRMAGAQRAITGKRPDHTISRKWREAEGRTDLPTTLLNITAPATDAARQWDGWGTALKPASEHWILCRKPLADATIAANVLAHGVGALNIAASRVAANGEYLRRPVGQPQNAYEWSRHANPMRGQVTSEPAGRWPPNVLFTHSLWCAPNGACAEDCPVAALDAQSGNRPGSHRQRPTHSTNAAFGGGRYDNTSCYGDTGTASRFFPTFRYQAKASRAERNRGCEGLSVKSVHRYGAGLGQGQHPESPVIERNSHPTVKPLALMTWLITLITPPDGIVLDPFAGSGSTCVAAKQGGWRYLGIEQSAEYVAIAEARLGAIK